MAVEVIMAFDGDGEFGQATRTKIEHFTTLLNSMDNKIKDFQILMENKKNMLDQKINGSLENVQARVEESQHNISSSLRVVVILFLLSIIFAVIDVVLIYTSIVNPLSNAFQLARSINKVNKVAEQQNSFTSQTVTATNEMALAINE